MSYLKADTLSGFDNISCGFVYDSKLTLEDVAQLANLDKILTLKQIHSDNVVFVNDSDSFISSEGDALITRQKGIGLGVYTADCVPILIYESNNRCISVIHSGWKGTLSKITKKAVEQINRSLGEEEKDYFAVIGPSIGKCCYEVGGDVAAPFIKKYGEGAYIQTVGNGKYMLDIVELNIAQLKRLGITKIEKMDYCTKCNNFLPSYRRDGKLAGRMLSFIGIQSY